MKDKMPKKGGRWWFSWRSRNSDSKSVSTQKKTLLEFRTSQDSIVLLTQETLTLTSTGISDGRKWRPSRELTTPDFSE